MAAREGYRLRRLKVAMATRNNAYISVRLEKRIRHVVTHKYSLTAWTLTFYKVEDGTNGDAEVNWIIQSYLLSWHNGLRQVRSDWRYEASVSLQVKMSRYVSGVNGINEIIDYRASPELTAFAELSIIEWVYNTTYSRDVYVVALGVERDS